MAGFSDKINSYIRGPKGKELVNKAKDLANKPENREKVQQLTNRFKRGGKGGTGPAEGGAGPSPDGTPPGPPPPPPKA